jgi:hypothetical protein
VGVVTDDVSYEQIIVFGGIHNTIETKEDSSPDVKSFLSNQTYLIRIKQREFNDKNPFKNKDKSHKMAQRK